MRGFTTDTEEIFRYVTKEAIGIEDSSGVFIKGVLRQNNSYAAEILKRLNYKDGDIPKRRVDLPPEKVLKFADLMAEKTGYNLIDSQHILLALAGCKNSAAYEMLRNSAIDFRTLAGIVEGMGYHQVGKKEKEPFQFDGVKTLYLAEKLKQRVIGQNEAIDAVSNRLKRAAAGLQNPNKPIAAFLFTGSTGVGKTELAKAVSEEIFGENSLVRFDMSEYSEKASVTSLIGAPPAYVGYEEGGRLTERIKKTPCAVVLFDEIEKAHRDVMNLLLQILDEGNLTDMRGVKVNFTKCIVILTANALSYDIIKQRRSIGFDCRETVADEREMLSEVFPPELLGRLKIVRFKDLNSEDYRQILSLEIAELNRRLSEKRISVTLTEDAEIELSKDTGYGVRGVRARVEELIESKLSDGILSGKIPEKAQVEARYFGGEILLNIKTTEEIPL